MKGFKRFIISALSALVVALGSLAFSSCNFVPTCEEHTWGEWVTVTQSDCTKKGERKHQCTVCDEWESEETDYGSHNYGNWIAEEPATCTQNGVLAHYHCSVCEKDFDAAYAELSDLTIAAGHKYDTTQWGYKGADGHAHLCTGDCEGHDTVLSHAGKYACSETCEECGYAITPTATHTYDNACDTDCNECGATRTVAPHDGQHACSTTCKECGVAITPDDTHKGEKACSETCKYCGTAITPAATHTYTNACDTDCNVCGATRTVAPHDGQHACSTTCKECGVAITPDDTHKGEKACMETCKYCGTTITPTATHTYTNACDTDCNECGAIREVEDHEYDNACDADCNECGATREVEDHEYDNACDTDCNECGATREVEDHQYDNACDTDCNECGATREVEDHQYDYDCDADCNVCGETREVEHVGEHECSTKCKFCLQAIEPATEHTGGEALCNELAVCEVCGVRYGETDPENHDYQKTHEVIGDCKTYASVTYTCTYCNGTYTETAETLADHTWEDVETVEATCQAGGYTVRECQVCHTK